MADSISSLFLSTLLLFPHSYTPFPSVPLVGREAQTDRKQLWKLFCLIRPDLGFSCGAMPQTFFFMKNALKKSLQCCFNFAPFVCLQGYPYAMDTAGSAKRLTARPERREERVQTPSSQPSLFQSLEFSPGQTLHLFSSLPPLGFLFLFFFKQKHPYFNLSLSSSSHPLFFSFF